MLVNYDIPGGFRRIYHFHVQKTGGTSLNHMFLALGGEDPRHVYGRLAGRDVKVRETISNDKIFVGWDKRLIQQGRYFYAFSHLARHQLRLPEGTFTVTCLRDPAERVLSLYREFLEYKINDVDHPCRTYSDKWLGNSFADFLNNIPKDELLQQLYMFSRQMQVTEALDGILSCSHILRNENFSVDCDVLSRKLQIDLQPMHIRRTSIKTDIDQGQLDRLRDLLEPEYRLLEHLQPHLQK